MPTPTQSQPPANSAAFPFSVGFPLSIRPQGDSLAICGANRGEGWPILCTVPVDTHHDEDATSIVAACTTHVNNALELPGSDRAKIAALVEALEHIQLVAREFWGRTEETDSCLREARAALSLAKEGTP